jgi:hypothetical protein
MVVLVEPNHKIWWWYGFCIGKPKSMPPFGTKKVVDIFCQEWDKKCMDSAQGRLEGAIYKGLGREH